MARTVFHGGTVFDGTGVAPAPGDVVVEDGRVVEVGAPGLDGDEAVDCSGLLPTGGCTIPTSLPQQKTAPSLPAPAQPVLPLPTLPLVPGLNGILGPLLGPNPNPSPAPLLGPLLGGLLGDWWPSAGSGGASLATLDLWEGP